MTSEQTTREKRANLLKWVLLAVTTVVVLYVVFLVYLGRHLVIGTMLLLFYAIAAYVYGSRRATTYRYLFPGLAGMVLFIVFPLLFTIWIGMTNYGSRNLLTFERATQYLLDQTYERGGERFDIEVHRDGDALRMVLIPEGVQLPVPGGSIFDEPADTSGSIFDEPESAPSKNGDDAAESPPEAGGATALKPPEPAVVRVPLVTEPIALTDSRSIEVAAVPLEGSGFTPGQALSFRELMDLERGLAGLNVRLPSGHLVVKSKLSLRVFSTEAPLYTQRSDGSLLDNQTGAILEPNFDTGFYTTRDGETVIPGFRVFVGFKHYVRLFTDPAFQQPFLRIFIWTVVFSLLTVVFSLIVGVLLAELLDWDGLRFRSVYRLLLFIPYAVPSFISILVFKGLFSENFGEINTFLDMAFGFKPHWFSDPFLAKSMILIVNTWLGYPYILLLWAGLKQSVPGDLYEASALAGSGPINNFFRITWPLLRRPLMPLLVSSFAFNFNNFVLIKLLTDGRPDFLDTSVAAGTTDILVSFTYRIAFQATDKNYGLASAIATVIFVMVAILSIVNLRLTKVNQGAKD